MFISVFILTVEVDNSFGFRVYVSAWQSKYLGTSINLGHWGFADEADDLHLGMAFRTF